ncbi:ATP-binding protein [Streptomyces boluensis]|uniref:ATP-binding protein n=1 Tax=Streptomyces boluensis TaxID=1775135 RepID=A0A964UNT9_9ACTN|nr:ATP-binding protein [Streptomyces boluensis]NBE52683.1 ATP-binding protein [Streptomyces boluensis]
MLRRDAFRLPRHPASVGLARLRVRAHLTAWGHRVGGRAVADAELLVSELATLLVRHGPLTEREFEVAATVLADGTCFLEVSDESDTGPELRAAPGLLLGLGDADHGRGLLLVESVANAWGVWRRGPHGKTVWVLVGSADHPAEPQPTP